MPKMMRQAIGVSIKELIELMVELHKQEKELQDEIGIKIDFNKRWSISIINRKTSDGKGGSMYCSDTWEFEKLSVIPNDEYHTLDGPTFKEKLDKDLKAEKNK